MHREIYEVNLQSLCVGVKPFSPIEFALQIFGYFNMFFDSVGESFKLDKNSTYGSNHRFYFHREGERTFHGNQYVKTRSVNSIGRDFCKRTGLIGLLLDLASIGMEYSKDLEDVNNFGITNYYRSVKAAGESLGSVLFGKIGVDMGMLIGSVGSPLGGLVGGVMGGVGGALLGQFIGGQLVDNYYRDNKLFIP